MIDEAEQIIEWVTEQGIDLTPWQREAIRRLYWAGYGAGRDAEAAGEDSPCRHEENLTRPWRAAASDAPMDEIGLGDLREVRELHAKAWVQARVGGAPDDALAGLARAHDLLLTEIVRLRTELRDATR